MERTHICQKCGTHAKPIFHHPASIDRTLPPYSLCDKCSAKLDKLVKDITDKVLSGKILPLCNEDQSTLLKQSIANVTMEFLRTPKENHNS